MDVLDQLYPGFSGFLVVLAVIAIVLISLRAAHWFLLGRNREMGEERRFPRRITMMILAVLGIVVILLALPAGDRRDQLVTLLGLILSAAIALASTTFVANAMAGLMLRTVRSFRPGDFIRVGEHFGRVTERGLFHIEIQTEDRDLTTLPNLFLVSNPVKVIRYSGTIVSATVSLGYDSPHQQVRSLLLQAGLAAELDEPFVQVLDLGDFSITYRVAGFLTEVRQLLTARSNLRSWILDTLHGAGVEIVSPTFMNQRRLEDRERVLPPEPSLAPDSVAESADPVPEERIFDKAEEAERMEQLRMARDDVIAEIEGLEESLKNAEKDERAQIKSEIDLRRKRAEAITEQLKGEESK